MQRVLAARGVASRRKAEELIRAGRVSVDGVAVSELGVRVDPTADIRVDGRTVRAEASRYILLNKPAGFITTTSDDKGRDTVMTLIGARERVYPVGRLDRETEGLLLLTNDGDVAHRVMHPRYKLAKEYTILTSARPPEAVMRRVRDGVEIDRRRIVPDEFRILRETRDGVLLTITVHEGLNRVVRRMMEEADIPIARLRRVRIGPLALGSIPVGGSRDLSGGELTSLLQALRLDTAESPHAGAAAKSGRPKPPARGRGPAYSGRRTPSARRVTDSDQRSDGTTETGEGRASEGKGREPEQQSVDRRASRTGRSEPDDGAPGGTRSPAGSKPVRAGDSRQDRPTRGRDAKGYTSPDRKVRDDPTSGRKRTPASDGAPNDHRNAGAPGKGGRGRRRSDPSGDQDRGGRRVPRNTPKPSRSDDRG